MVGRFGGHQRGGTGGGKYPRNKSPEKVPGRRRRSLDTDRWLYSGHTRMAHVIGTTWIQSMCGSQGLNVKFEELVSHNPHQVRGFDKQAIIDTLKARTDSGGIVVINQEIYLRSTPGVCSPITGLGSVPRMTSSGIPMAASMKSGSRVTMTSSADPMSPSGGRRTRWISIRMTRPPVASSRATR